jgi:hypothetical protein
MSSRAPALVLLKRTLCNPTQLRLAVVAVVNPVKVAVSVPPPANVPTMTILMGGGACRDIGADQQAGEVERSSRECQCCCV